MRFDWKTVDMPDSVICREMNFLDARETLHRYVVDQKHAVLGPSDLCIAVGAPPNWTRREADTSVLLHLDRRGVQRSLGSDQYQVIPPDDLSGSEFQQWASRTAKYIDLSLHAPSILCMDFSDLLDVLRSAPTGRCVSDVLPIEACETLESVPWLQCCSRLLCVAFDGGTLPYVNVMPCLERVRQRRQEGLPPVISIKVQPRQPQVIFLLAGIGQD